MDSACLKPGGDPSLTYSSLYDGLIPALQEAGVVGIRDLVIDTSGYGYDEYNDVAFPTSWMWEDITAAYGGMPTAAIMDENTLVVDVSPASASGLPPSVMIGGEEGGVGVEVVNSAVTVADGEPLTLVVGYEPASGSLFVRGNVPIGSGSHSRSASVLSPYERYGNVTASVLLAGGIKVPVIRLAPCGASSDLNPLAVVRSPPLSQLMNYTLQYSDNLYAETWMRVGGELFATDIEGTALGKGLVFVKHHLSNVTGIDPDGFHQWDGSGVSPKDIVTPSTLADLLEFMHPHKEYLSFLPVGAVSGTLKHRFIGTVGAGRVVAKTGTLTGVNSLSGFVLASDTFPDVVFSILTNHSPYHASTIREAIDDIVVLFASLQSC